MATSVCHQGQDPAAISAGSLRGPRMSAPQPKSAPEKRTIDRPTLRALSASFRAQLRWNELRAGSGRPPMVDVLKRATPRRHSKPTDSTPKVVPEVYKAQHKTTGDVVAVKKIKLGARSWEDALRSTELAALRALRHPCIVRLKELIRSPVDRPPLAKPPPQGLCWSASSRHSGGAGFQLHGLRPLVSQRRVHTSKTRSASPDASLATSRSFGSAEARGQQSEVRLAAPQSGGTDSRPNPWLGALISQLGLVWGYLET